MAQAARSLSTINPSDSSTECTPALLRKGLHHYEETIISLSLSGEFPQMLAASRRKALKIGLMIRHNGLMEAIKAEAL
jgi:hypothetical protein